MMLRFYCPKSGHFDLRVESQLVGMHTLRALVLPRYGCPACGRGIFEEWTESPEEARKRASAGG